ncbi:MAG: glycosyltransferase family 2 protein [Nitrospinales bacterium]
MSEGSPKIIFSILTSGQRESLIESLQSIQELNIPEKRVLLVDGGPRSALPDTIRKMKLDLIHLQVESDLGIATHRTEGLKHLLTLDFDYVLQLDDDVVLQPGCFQRLLAVMEEDPRLGLAAPVILDNRGGVLSAGGVYYRHLGQPILFHTPNPTARSLDFATGTMGLIRKRALQDTGLMDLRFDPYGFEDIDYCLRMRDRGWAIRLAPDARCLHVTSYSFHNETVTRLFQTTAHRLLCAWKFVPGFWFFTAFLPWYMIRRVAYPVLKFTCMGRIDLAAAVARGVRHGWRKKRIAPLNPAGETS